MKKAISVLLCIIIALGLTACGTPSGSDTPDTPKDPTTTDPGTTTPDGGAAVTRDTVYIGTDGDCGSLDPYVVSGSGFLPVRACYCEGLWENGETTDGFASKYMLAESVDVISDIEYVIHLRQGVTFSNGNPFTASDVIFTLNHVINDTNRASYLASVDMEKTVAEDDYTVRLFLKSYDKTQMLSLRSIAMLDEESFDAETIGQRPIGTGAYVVTDYVVNSTVTLEARDDYWGGTPAIKKIVFKNIPEASQKVTALETGEIDMLIGCPNADAEYVDGLDNVRTIVKPSMNQVCLTYNGCEGSPLESKEARWAVSYAVNTQGIIDVALSGNGVRARTPYSSGATDFYEEFADIHDTYKTGYNLELAKKYAEESGLVGKTVRLVTNGADVYVTTAQIIEQSLKEIGVNAEVVNFDQATVRNLIAGEADWEVYVSWTSNPSELGLDIMYSQISKFNRSHFDKANGELFKTLSDMGIELLATSDETAYKALLKDYLTEFEDNCYVYGIADVSEINAASDSLQGVNTRGHQYEYVKDWYFVD